MTTISGTSPASPQVAKTSGTPSKVVLENIDPMAKDARSPPTAQRQTARAAAPRPAPQKTAVIGIDNIEVQRLKRPRPHNGPEQQRGHGDIKNKIAETDDGRFGKQPRLPAEYAEPDQPEDGQDDGENGDHGRSLSIVMPGLDPAIHVAVRSHSSGQDVDARIKSGHDEFDVMSDHLAAQLFLEQLVDHLRVRLALRRLHGLSGEPARDLGVALRYWSACSGLSAMIWSMTAEISPLSLICLRPFSSTIASASLPLSNISSKTSLAILPEMVPSAIRSIRPPSCAA